LTGAERGVLAHALLERLDFRRPSRPTPAMLASVQAQAGLARAPAAAELEEAADLVDAFAGTELCARLGEATHVRREEAFTFLLDGVLVRGALDVLAREPDGRMLIVDYKSDRLGGSDPASAVDGSYGTQRLVYALAALRAGAEEVEVVHVFLEVPEHPVTARFTRADTPTLERELATLARGVMERDFAVSDVPHRDLCNGCPAEGGLCSWPLELTRRETPERLF
jgi:ATP-dependent exoDNAse (exonuclease V) beta subunit